MKQKHWMTLLLFVSLWVCARRGYSQEAFEHFQLPDGLEATVWAKSPKFFNPTNIDVDYKGRIWVTEAVNYRGYNNNDGKHRWHENGDRVMVVKDTDEDGKADTSHVFVQDEDLVAPMGISVMDNQVLVSCSPYILKYTDVNRNGTFDSGTDRKEKFLSGFGGLDHDHAVHTVVSGPGGRWYFTTGNAGPHKVTDNSGWTLRAGSFYTGGSPHHTSNEPGLVSDDGRVYVGGIGARINPDGTNMTVIGHNFRNAYEMYVDSFGNYWQTDNDDTISCRTTWLMKYGNTGYASADGARRWSADRRPGQDLSSAHWHQKDPGVIPSGDVYGSGAPTGIVRYENGSLGKKYRGVLFSAEAGRNLIWTNKPRRNGAGFELTRSRSVFMKPKENEDRSFSKRWFRPSDVAVGADGTIYVADWLDPFSGGHRYDDLDASGTIYRIKPEGENPKTPDINLDTTEGQFAALKSPSKNVRYAGLKRLRRKGTKVLPEARQLLDHDNRFIAARAIWLLAQLGQEGKQQVEDLLDSGDPATRVTAFRALQQVSDPYLPYARQLADDPSLAVRRTVALSLRDVPLDRCKQILLTLMNKYSGNDRWYLEAIGTAADRKESAVYDLLQQSVDTNPLEWSEATADLVWRLHPPQAVQPLRKRAMTESVSLKQRKKALAALGFIETRSAAEAMLNIAKDGPEDTRKLATWWARHRSRNLWSDYDLDLPERSTAESDLPIMKYRGMLRSRDGSKEELKKVAKKLSLSPVGGGWIIRMASRGELPEYVKDTVEQHIYDNPSASIRQMATRYFPRSTPGGEPLPSIDKMARMEGNPSSGKKLFHGKAGCGTCHQFRGKGKLIGPNLTQIRQKYDRSGLLDALINPSSSVTSGYQASKIETKDGETVMGILVSKGEQLVVQDVTGKKHTIEQANIASRNELERSIMPSVTSVGLNAEEIVDLVSFLSDPPSSGDSSNADD